MEINVAKTAGFCFGVNRAVDIVYDLAQKDKKVCTLGPIIHNPQVVEDLQSKGVRIIDNPDDTQEKEIVIIRSHGVGKDVYDYFDANAVEYIDATCPFVSKIHKIVKDNSKSGKIVFILGNESHPEVIGIKGHCEGESYVVTDYDDFNSKVKSIDNFNKKTAVLVAQTTHNVKSWEEFIKNLKKDYTNIEIFDTICSATGLRQTEAVDLAQNSDLMIVIGGKHSSNTVKLSQVCEKYAPTMLVETSRDLDKDALKSLGANCKIGVTAGASTPAYIIKEVLNTMSEIITEHEEFDFEQMLEKSLNERAYRGKRVKGIVTAVYPNEVQVDIGAKQAGFIPLDELTEDPNLKAADVVKKGDELDLIVIQVNDAEGIVMLSKKRCDADVGFENICKAFEEQAILDGVVVSVVRGGLLVLTNDVKVFVPASQASDTRVENLETLLKTDVQLKITEIKQERRRAIGSIRKVKDEIRQARAQEVWNSIEVGKVYTGTVKSLASYGAFVDIGGVDGMVHITELSWSKIKHPQDVVKVGDTVEVYVKDLDTEKKRISLGYKKTEDNPWVKFEAEYNVGDVVNVTIVSVTQFGAFAQIIPGIEGLIHISQIANKRIDKVADVLKVGDKVDAKIIDADLEAKRISLSIRVLLEEQETEEEAQIVADAEAAGVEITSDEAVEEAEVEAPAEEAPVEE